MAQVTRDIIQLKKSKTGDVFYPETHMQAVIGLNGNKDANTVLAGPTSGSAGPASFRPLYPTDIIPLFTKEYTYKCTANDTNNGNIYFMNVTPTSDDWATPWSVHYTLQVDCLTSEDANSKYCHGFYDIYVGSAGSNYYYHVFNTFYSSSYYPVYYHKLLYHNTEAKYTSYHITNPVKLGARIQSAWGPNTRTRIYNIKVYDYKNCTISFPENIEIYGDVYRDTYYNTIDWNATSTGLQETSDQNDTTTMNLYYTRLQAGTNGIKQYSLVMQDKNGKWQSFTKGAGGTATTKEKNDAEFRLGSRIYRMGRSSDLGADGYLSNGQVQAYCTLVDLRYSLNIVSNNSATGGSVGLTQYKPVYIVGTINSNGYFILDDIWWTQDEPITEDGKIYIRIIDSVYLDNPNNPNGQYRGDLISDGYAYYYKNGSFQRYVIADSANTVPWSGVTGKPSFYDLVIKASDATTLLTYKPTTSGTYQLQLSASQIGLGKVENTKLSIWAGTSNITTLGTISTGTWHGSTIDVGYGGTGKTSWTQYGVLYADTTSSLSQVVNNTTSTRKFLRMVGSNNAATAPAWDTVTKTDVGLSNVENTALSTWAGTQNITIVGTIATGTWNATTISTGKGGTGLTTYTKGDMLYASANNTLAKLGANTGTKKFLSMASSVPSWEAIATSDLPAMYIGKTAVKFENTTEQALTGISTGAFSSSITVGNGSTPASNEQASTTQKRRIYFGSSNYYIEVDKNGYLHTNVGFYSDSFVSAGGLSNAGGSSGIDSDALWELLAAGTSEQINSSHLPKGSAADLNSGTSTTGVTWGAKTIADYVTSQINTTVSSALYFRGQSSTAITNGGTETATINGQALTAQTGDLVLYDGKEFAWDGSHWIQFGDESSWASKNISISTSGYLTGGGDLTTSRTISINTNKISDSSAASSLSSTSTNLVTERDIYYGLPTINNSHAYTSGTTIYAPTSAGTANQVLLSGGANTAPTWGNASGLSVGTASKLGSSTVGSTTKPIYLSSGTATECNTYAGGTAVTLNNASKAASTASFYAPTAGGTAGYLLIGKGTTTAPDWSNVGFIDATNSRFGIGTTSPAYKLDVNGTTHTTSLIIGTTTDAKNVSLVWDDTAKAWHLNGNFYADGFISAGGLSNSSGGGGVDIDAVWASLTNSVTDEYANTRIAQSHLPAISSSGSGVVSAIAYSGSGNSLVLSVTKTAVVTSLGTKTGAITLSGGLSIDSNNVLSSTDTKNTAGADNTTSKIFLVGPTAQTSSNGNARTYSNVNCYASGGKLYSNAVEVVNLSNTQALTNKTYNGYTLAAACAKGVTDNSSATAVTSSDTNLITGRTLYYAGYVKSSGVTSITLTSGTGITVSDSGTAITGTGSRTISLNVAGAKTALGLGTMAYETASNYLTTTTAASTYVKLSPGTSEQTISSSISSLAKGVINLWRSSGDHYTFLGFSNGTTETYLGGIGFKSQSDHNLYHKDGSSYYTIFDENNYTSYVNTTNFPGLNKTGTITKVSTGTGLTGGDITTTGTISINSTYQGYITHGESAYNSLGNYVLKAGDSMTGGLAICLTPSSSYPVDRTKATLIVEDDSAAATGEIQGGNIIISRGYSATANQSAGAITFYGRRLSGGYRNGARIASIASVVGTSYDRQDLVFYTSNNTNDSSPAFEETMRIRADKAVSMSGWLSVSRDAVYNIYANNTASGGTASGIRFQLNGTTKGGLFVNSDENLYYSVGTASTGNKVLTSANYDGFALPLAGGTMTGSIKLTNGTYINAESGYTMCGIGSGGDTFYCGPGAEITSAFYIRSGNINLTHVKAGTNYTIWDASNSNLSTVDWAANNLTVAGTSTFSDTMYVENRKYMYWKDSGGTSRNVFGLNNTDSLLIGYGLTSVTGSVVAIYGETVRLNTGMTELVQANGATLMLAGTGVNTGGSKILFRSSNTSDQNGFKIEAEAAASSSNRGRLALNFFTSNNTTSPYAPDWKRAMRISYNGNIMFGNTTSGSEFYPTVYSYGPLQVGTSTTNKNLTVYGSITSSGDQVISSDATKKKNWRDLKYGVADIAKATAGVFDWKDGKGESAGTKAQDWMHLVPQLVHGEEGHMTLAYGQIAMLNTILLARRSEDHETRIKALELENAELRKEIKRLMS